jgi:glycosyltransferase involved in cell wall biosynthesis
VYPPRVSERLLKILIVHEVNYLSKIIYEFQIVPEILSILGHEVTVIDYDDSWRSTEGAPIMTSRRIFDGVGRAYTQAAVRLIRPAMVRLPLISRISGALAGSVEVHRFLEKEKPDVILLYGVPTIGMQVLAIAKRFAVPVVFRSIDVSHQLVPSSLLVPATRALEKYVYTRARFNMALTPHLRDYIMSYGVSADRVRLLPSGVDTKMFCPGPPARQILDQWEIAPGGRVILFMGTIYRFSGLDKVIRDFPILLRKHPKAKLVIVGAGEDESRLRQLSGENGVEQNVVFAGLRSYAELPDIIRSSDVCINPFELNEITAKILPTKLFQYLACGIPVLATELPGTVPFLSGEEHGVVYCGLENFVERLSDVLSNDALRSDLGRRGVALATQYEWENITRTMVDWLKEVA